MPLLKSILNKIKNMESKRIIKNGTRNMYYLIGKQNANPTNASNSGQLVLFVSNVGSYNSNIPGIFTVSNTGIVNRSTFGAEPPDLKEVLVYTDNTYDYIFLHSPNYHDNFWVDVIVDNGITLDVQEMTEEEFNTYITGMTRISTNASWRNMTLLNSWVKHSSGTQNPPQYRKESGIVSLHGCVQTTVATTAENRNICQLPNNYIPSGISNNLYFVTRVISGSESILSNIQITPTGIVMGPTGLKANDWLALDGITFPA